MSAIIAKINAATAQDMTGSPRARLTCRYLDRIADLSRRAHGGRSRFSSVTCGAATARLVNTLGGLVPDIKAAGLAD